MELPPLKCVARIRSDFPTKFGIPRQSGLVEALRATVVFEPEYRDPAALRGLEGFSHLWLLWLFSASVREGWSPTVRPPRLGGNVRMGVFATRSPFRPNPIGLSSVRLEGVDLHTPEGPVLVVSGADLMDGTPILDIKPYLPYGDCHPEASADKREALLGVLARDPRPSYQSDPERVYGMAFAGWDIRFSVAGEVLTVREIAPLEAHAPSQG
ncbi:tRNA (N6-threonylcarbamoyladenosine(37)-N6)-methyltransferase TrmO [uncultured Intestinimonas sp.]|uniref:tRNA (N6-threonylcarbamoyladenosine(37)-N6)-methyltransferase TrmO n=1 Tax=uncultured Intestinimonas sp. TaxID=1689265 RepID=UPI0025E5DFA9|nr:tRNA (N6-threonylcarbamoyladenosine(37)-N6)-methyltransferase TrmO [uncultured Intestinimonas sp.]